MKSLAIRCHKYFTVSRRLVLLPPLSSAQQQQQRIYYASRKKEKTASIPFYGAPRPLSNNQSSSFFADDCTITDSAAAAAAVIDRLWLTWNYAITAAKDPTRADAVAAVGELTGGHALQNLLEKMRNHETGRQILRDRPIVSKATIPYEKLMEEAKRIDPDDEDSSRNITFGQAYGLFLLQHGFDPDERDKVKYIGSDDDDDGGELAYVMTRYRQCHDFWHALTGLPPTVAGELGLKWLELFQTGLPVTALSCTAGSLFTLSSSSQDQHLVWNVYLPWARRQAQQQQQQRSDNNGVLLMNVYYEREWETPLNELRQRLCLEAAPTMKN